MAFSDEDIRAHMRSITVPNGRRISFDADRSHGTSDYHSVSTYGRRDADGNGVEPHRAKLRRELTERFTLSEVGDRSKNHLGTLKWEK